MTDQMLHTPDGVRDIYNGECKQKLLLQERLHDVLRQHHSLNFLIFLEKKSVQHHPKICISFLTRTEARWYFVRILLHLLQEVLQSTIPRMICR